MISLRINGQNLEVQEGRTVLQAAAELGVIIPTLCYHKDLSPFGGCRLCVVKIRGARLPMTACNLPVSPGLVVETDAPEVIRYRKAVLRMLLSRYYDAAYKRFDGKLDIEQDSELAHWARVYEVDIPSIHGEKTLPPGRQRPQPLCLGGYEQMHPVHPLCAGLCRSPGALCLVAVIPRIPGAHRGWRRFDHAGLALRILRRLRGVLSHRRLGQQNVGEQGARRPPGAHHLRLLRRGLHAGFECQGGCSRRAGDAGDLEHRSQCRIGQWAASVRQGTLWL